jgi:hypothetical protein
MDKTAKGVNCAVNSNRAKYVVGKERDTIGQS